MSRTITQNKSISLLLVKNNIMGNQRCASSYRPGWLENRLFKQHPPTRRIHHLCRSHFCPRGETAAADGDFGSRTDVDDDWMRVNPSERPSQFCLLSAQHHFFCSREEDNNTTTPAHSSRGVPRHFITQFSSIKMRLKYKKSSYAYRQNPRTCTRTFKLLAPKTDSEPGLRRFLLTRILPASRTHKHDIIAQGLADDQSWQSYQGSLARRIVIGRAPMVQLSSDGQSRRKISTQTYRKLAVVAVDGHRSSSNRHFVNIILLEGNYLVWCVALVPLLVSVSYYLSSSSSSSYVPLCIAASVVAISLEESSSYTHRHSSTAERARDRAFIICLPVGVCLSKRLIRNRARGSLDVCAIYLWISRNGD